MFIEYDNLDLDKAIAKLKSKISWDEEDKAFARARAEYLTPEELAVIEGGEVPPQAPSANQMTLDNPTASKPEENTSEVSGETLPPAPENSGVELVSMKMTLEQLQGKAADLDLDTSGVKQELVDRINKKLTEPAVPQA